MKNRVTSVYKQAERFAEITKSAITCGIILRAKKCLALAEELFTSGSYETRNAISNVYVFRCLPLWNFIILPFLIFSPKL